MESYFSLIYFPFVSNSGLHLSSFKDHLSLHAGLESPLRGIHPVLHHYAKLGSLGSLVHQRTLKFIHIRIIQNLTNRTSAMCSKSASTVRNHVGSMYLWYDVRKMVLCLYDLLPQISQPQSDDEKTPDESKVRDSYKTPDQYCSKLSREKTENGKKKNHLEFCHSKCGPQSSNLGIT